MSSGKDFDPNGPGIAGKLFGLPFDATDAWMVVVPVPWEVTVSYQTGTANGPAAVLRSSSQVDLFNKDIPDAWKLGVTMADIPESIRQESQQLRCLAERHLRRLESEGEPNPLLTQKINQACESLNVYVKSTTKTLLQQGKMVGILGGDHSTPLGFLQTLSEQYDRFGILQVDAHADLRKAYEGFQFSHASIMYNAMKLPSIGRLVSVGIRDWCEEEWQVVQRSHGRIKIFHDETLHQLLDDGQKWSEVCKSIVKELPDNVYISFDIDGLDPSLCPHTGTPVPGGLSFYQAQILLRTVATSGKRIIGFDLCEVAPGTSGEWDASVGARLLNLLCTYTGVSNGKLKIAGG